MLKPTRFVAACCTCALTLSIGCSNEKTPAEPPKPVPRIHPDGPPSPHVPELAKVSPPDRPSGTIAKILQEPEMFERVRRLAEVMPTLGPEAIPEVKQALERLDSNTGGIELALLAHFWALHEPKAASQWALHQSPLAYRLALTLPTMEEWARVDPIDAQLEVSAVSTIPGSQTLAMELALVRGWFYSETPGLEDYVRGLGPGPTRQRSLRFMLRLILDEHGPEKARKWVESLDDNDKAFKLSAFRQLAVELGQTHLREAMDLCETYCEHPVWGNGLRKHIAQQWAKQDGPSVMEWLKQSPRSEETARATKWAFSGWYNADRDGLFAWLDSIGPEGVEPWMQPMLELVAVNVGRVDPEKGIAWARVVADGPTRTRTTVTVATNWHRRDPVAAEAWLDQSALPDVAKQRVLFYGRPKSEIDEDKRPAPEPVTMPSVRDRGDFAEPAE